MVDAIWYDFDSDRNGYLDQKECKRFVEFMNHKSGITDFDAEDFDLVFKLFDINGSGTIEKEEMFIFMMYLTSMAMEDQGVDVRKEAKKKQKKENKKERQRRVEQKYINDLLKKPVKKWILKEVLFWLINHIHMPKYQKAFKEQKING